MHQDYSSLGIRKLMISSMSPLKLWDSPSRDDSPDAILKSAAKTFTSMPSILKKRHRDLVSPLSEKRVEKKLEGCIRQESFSHLTKDFSRRDVMFDECCIDKKGSLVSPSPSRRNFEVSCIEKENVTPACGQEEYEGNKSIVISESKMSMEGLNDNGNECVNKITEKTATEVRNKAGNNDGTEVGGEPTHVDCVALFKKTRCSLKTGCWTEGAVDNEIVELREQYRQTQVGASQPVDKIEIASRASDEALGKRSGYIKGLGYGPKPAKLTSSDVSSSRASNAELREELTSTENELERTQNELEETRASLHVLEAKIERLEANQSLIMQVFQKIAPDALQSIIGQWQSSSTSSL